MSGKQHDQNKPEDAYQMWLGILTDIFSTIKRY